MIFNRLVMIARHRMRLVALGLLIILSLIFFHQLAIGGKILARGDTFEYFYPYWDARNQAFREGRLPLWAPELFMGAPLLANPQLGSYYPPNWLTAPFRAPSAIALSLLFHIVLAGAGACWLYRETVSQRWLPALAAAVVYAFSGFLGAHVEQINQLQGLAWLPLLFALAHRLLTRDRPLRDGLLLGMAWALQIFSGHTQTVFISGLGLGAFAIALSARAAPDIRWKRVGRALLMLGCCCAAALCLSLPQLLPSLELLRLSIRSDGLEPHSVSAFSLPPDLLGRALLPSYDGQLFGEYVGTIGVIGLGLALWGIAARPRFCGRKWIWLSLAALGLLLALGNHNPLYRLLDDWPPLNYFRAPARFLSLFTLGMAMLAGLGVESLEPAAKPARAEPRRIALALCPLLLLIALTAFISPANPAMIFGDSSISARALGLWLGAALLLAGLLLARGRWMPIAAFALLTGELFLAAQNLPYNDLSPPDVYLGQRPAISELLRLQADEPAPGRTLGISQIFFDPVDIAELRRRYDELGMGYWAQFHALDAVKKQETLMPNLALTWGIPGLDGYGGGITPTRHYVLFSSLLLPDEAASAVDGRLGERLALPACRGACIPELRWLRASDTQYIITDYVYDIQHDGIAYDTALAPFWADVSSIDPPETSADQVRILYSAPVSGDDSAIELPHGLWLRISDYAEPAALVDALRDKEKILAVTLVDSLDPQNYTQLQPPPFKRLHVSAVKIYRQATSERAFLAGAAHVLPDNESGDAEALRLLRAGERLTLHGDVEAPTSDDPGGGKVEILSYTEARIELRVMAPAPAYLVLKDAYYPGWEASVNGAPTPIYRANLLFRALSVPAGESVVIFRFEPALWRAALYIGLALWIIAAIALHRLRLWENAA
ncbi:MAG: YfhO family protein [Chloroflexota bacterium]|nr:YfhO family protein [Chloroflexota bacterium]